MRRMTAWIYGLLTAALLVYAAYRYGRVKLQTDAALERLERLERTASQLASENSVLAANIGRIGSAYDDTIIASGQDPVVMTDGFNLADDAD